MAVLNLLLLLSALSQSWAAPAPVTPRATCYSGVYMIVARASGELPGEGLIQPVADGIQARIPDSASVAVAYPATLVAYKASLSGGVADMTKKIKAYVDACGAASDIVLLGYSQGAQVVSSTLAGSSGMPLLGLPLLASGGISTDYSKYSASQSASTSGPGMLTNPRSVSGAILMGDVSFTAGQPFDAGNSTQSGIMARSGASLKKLNTYASLIRSYCDLGDPFCASGNDFPVHTKYVEKYGANAVDFIVGLPRLGGA